MIPPQKRSLSELLTDIVGWGRKLERFTRGVSFQEFVADEVLQLACIKCIEVVGEAAGVILRTYPSFAETEHGLPLAEAYRTRNRLSHGYDLVDFQIIWSIATRDIPSLVERTQTSQSRNG